jgi:hypothetical protein
MAACSSTPKPQETVPKPEIKRILVAPVADPKIGFSGGRVRISNMILDVAVGVALGASPRISDTSDERNARVARQSAWIKEALDESHLALGQDISQFLVSELTKQGYVADMVPTEFLGPPRDPLELKYDKLKDLADAVFVIEIRNSALNEYREITMYEPQLNISVDLIQTGTGKRIRTLNYVYGNDASTGVKGNIRSTKECIFTNLGRDAAFGNALATCFRNGAQLLARNAAQDLAD